MAFILVCMSWLLFMLLSSYAFQLLTDARRRLPPGPRPLPVIGNILDVVGKLPHRSLASLAERYGPLMTLRLGTVVVIVASSASTAREVLQTHNAVLAGRNPPDAWHGMGHAANSVFVLPPRRKWRALRRIGAEHLLSPRRLDADALRPLLQDAVLGMLGRVSELAASGAAVEVGHAAFASMMDLQWRAMFSAGLDEPTSRELHCFAREAVAHSLRPNVSDFFPAFAAADIQRIRRGFTAHLARVYQLIDQQIDRRRTARETTGGGEARKDDLLDVLLDMSEQGKDVDGGLVNQQFMRSFFTDIFLAANDTVSGTIEWAMAELLQDPQTMTKLQQELKRVLGSKTHVDYSDIDQLPYLQAVVKETLRLHAVVPLVPNKAEATVEIHGHTVPKGSTVLVNLWAIHHDVELWPEPYRFVPERFLQQEQAEVSFQGAADFRFIPFSAGRRTCLGLPMATRMLHAMLGSLLHRFEWSLPREVEGHGVDMSEKLGITMAMATPLQAMARRI